MNLSEIDPKFNTYREKIGKAAESIICGEPMSEIFKRAGYKNLSNFKMAFKKGTGMTVEDYKVHISKILENREIIQKRLEEIDPRLTLVKNLIGQTKTPDLAIIATQSGFKDEKEMRKVFTDQFGYTLDAYMRHRIVAPAYRDNSPRVDA